MDPMDTMIPGLQVKMQQEIVLIGQDAKIQIIYSGKLVAEVTGTIQSQEAAGVKRYPAIRLTRTF